MDKVVKLKKLLEKVKHDVEKIEIEEIFNDIARCLLSEVIIKKGKDGQKYNILEIEFYYSSAKYPESKKTTYPRKAKAGDWYFHQYGMDLCFESDPFANEPYYGGILIRSIQRCDVSEAKLILGPGKVCDALFSVYNAFENIGYDENMPKIEDKHDYYPVKIDEPTYRYHIEDRKYNIGTKLRYTIKGFADKDISYFNKNRLGYSCKEAKERIKMNLQPED